MPKSDTAKSMASNNSYAFKTLPHSLEAEQCLLGSIMLDNAIYLDALASLVEEDFYSPTNQIIISAMHQVNRNRLPVDFVTLADELSRTGKMSEVGGMAYLTSLNEVVVSSANWETYLSIVKKHSLMRALIKNCTEITQDAFETNDADKTLAQAEGRIFRMNSNISSSDLEKVSRSAGLVISHFESIQKDPDSIVGVKTGFSRLDNLTNGFKDGEFIVIAGRPGMGKTSLAMNFVEFAAIKEKRSIAVFSLEMSKKNITERLLCSYAGVPMKTGRTGKLTEKDWKKLWDANEVFDNCKLYIDDTARITTDQILAKCRRLKSREGLDMIMIDYIQLMEADKSSVSKGSENRQQEVSSISRNLKLLARELEVPVIALSQLKRVPKQENGKTKKPELSDLRESGAIEQDADIVMMLYKPDINETEEDQTTPGQRVELVIAKHRNGETMDLPFDWYGESFRFKEGSSFERNMTNQYNQNQEQKAATMARLAEEQAVPQMSEEQKQHLLAPQPDEAPPEVAVKAIVEEE